ncbi:hypothetical protein GGS26DRAFT_558501 [Hypomontagnella submonticulosa]|nr:hypothetical protein GGS26DRAFT_558501 [Hypomontagnella submonticulosa]
MDITNKRESHQKTTDQRSLVSLHEPIHSRLDDFLKEPLDAGNKNVMLPDQSDNKIMVANKAKERVGGEIKKIMDVLNQPRS